MKPTFFADAAAFRQWLARNHQEKKEILVGFYKAKSGSANMSWSESVDQALCFGWIDGVRKSVDDKRYTIRFTPRKESSNWSAINIKKMKSLSKKGLVAPAGQAIFEKRKSEKSKVYTYENAPLSLDADLAKKFKTHDKAWQFFEAQAPGYRKVIANWIMSGKELPTRHRRLEKLIAASQLQKKLL